MWSRKRSDTKPGIMCASQSPAEMSDEMVAGAPAQTSGEAVPVIYGVPEGQDSRVLVNRARDQASCKTPVLHVALDDTRISALAEQIAFFDPDVEVVTFPAWDCLPYDRVSPSADIVAARVAGLSRMLEWQGDNQARPRIILTTVNAVLQRVMPRTALEKTSLSASKGGRLDLEGLHLYLGNQGYVRTQTVREPGEYAVRGDIVDIYPSGHEFPVRIDLFGDEVEKIRTFDPMTQISQEEVGEFSLRPVSEFFLDEESIQRFRRQYREYFGVARGDDPLYAAVSEGRRHAGMEHWLPLFYEKMDTIFDYCPDAPVFLDYHGLHAAGERHVQIADFYQARKTLEEQATDKQASSRKGGDESGDVSMSGTIYRPLPVANLYIPDGEWSGILHYLDVACFSPFASPHAEDEAGGGAADTVVDTGARKARDFAGERARPDGDVFGALSDYISGLRQEAPDRPVILAAYSTGARDRLQGLMENAGFSNMVPVDEGRKIKKLVRGQTGLAILGLENGFIAPDMAVISEQDILGDRLARKTRKKKKADNFITEISSLEPGDLVVHADHGIGRFEALETLKAAGTLHDCLKLVYDGGDKLYVPVENIEILSRFGHDEGAVALDKLGGVGWQARKARVKKDLMRMADELLEIAANRQLQRADKIDIPDHVYQEFVARFPYHETEDQLQAINDSLADMHSGQPMDRLVCGDVGFGKTEVALRAAYVAAMDGYQVAVVVPTTLLARQHYHNFLERFKGTGLKIEQLSRLVNPKAAEQVRQGLASGEVNIVIGTHALLGKQIKFDHLGLLIVDEEQRFGVKQKEKLKELKHNVHVLTLTATPIPRTLQMSLSGVKEMSIIATPPVDRLAIRTFVLPFDPVVVREAVLREHYRGGQTFYVCPRIKDLTEVEERLKELVPEVRVITAHGQIPANELEDRMTAFYDGQYDVLLATNIIESGLDIPSANTMIVHRADLFGLAQLYQIRGRIGRSKMRAYAYLTYNPQKRLNAQAQKKLEVIETLDSLGAGFQLASHDMDIRGAGNLLGEEQSGHIREVGVELFQQMLEEAVAAARSGVDIDEALPGQHWTPTINLGTSVLIPETYVEDLSVRMSLYRRLAELNDENDIESFAAEMIDRFGPVPEEFENLLDIVRIKQLCKQAGIDRVEAGPKGATIGFYKDTPPNVEGLMRWMQDKQGAIKLRADHKLVAARSWEKAEQRVKGVKSLIRELARVGQDKAVQHQQA